MGEGAIGAANDARATLSRALVAVGGGDRRAFALIYERTSAKLFGICLRILGSRSEAEEVLQEAYVNVWRNAGRFDPERASPISWLAALARNKAIDRLRAKGPRTSEPIDGDTLQVADPSPLASELLEASEDRERLGGCIGELEQRQAAAIRRAFFGGLTYAELAQADSVPLGTMKSWIRRGLAKLKECLER